MLFFGSSSAGSGALSHNSITNGWPSKASGQSVVKALPGTSDDGWWWGTQTAFGSTVWFSLPFVSVIRFSG